MLVSLPDLWSDETVTDDCWSNSDLPQMLAVSQRPPSFSAAWKWRLISIMWAWLQWHCIWKHSVLRLSDLVAVFYLVLPCIFLRPVQICWDGWLSSMFEPTNIWQTLMVLEFRSWHQFSVLQFLKNTLIFNFQDFQKRGFPLYFRYATSPSFLKCN